MPHLFDEAVAADVKEAKQCLQRLTNQCQVETSTECELAQHCAILTLDLEMATQKLTMAYEFIDDLTREVEELRQQLLESQSKRKKAKKVSNVVKFPIAGGMMGIRLLLLGLCLLETACRVM